MNGREANRGCDVHSRFLADAAIDALRQELTARLGRQFWGKVGVTVTLEGGRVTAYHRELNEVRKD